MAKTCNNCGEQEHANDQITMSGWAYEAHEARHERRERRLWIALLVAIGLLFASNVGWLIYQSQYDTYSYDYQQDGEGQNNINAGTQGDIIYEPTIEDKNP